MKQKRFRFLLSIICLLLLTTAAVYWLRLHSFESQVIRAGGKLFVDNSDTVTKSTFVRTRDRFFSRLLGAKDQRLHHIRFVNGTINDDWLKRHRDKIENLSAQTWITLEQSRVSSDGLATLRGMSDITTLILSGTPLTGDALEHLATMPDLWNLDISETGIPDDALAVLKQFPVLQCITVDASQATELGLGHISEIPQLLTVSLVKPTDETLSWLRNALYLTVEEATITPRMIMSFKSMARLSSLTLTACQFIDCSEEQLRAALPNCQIKLLSNNEVERFRSMGQVF